MKPIPVDPDPEMLVSDCCTYSEWDYVVARCMLQVLQGFWTLGLAIRMDIALLGWCRGFLELGRVAGNAAVLRLAEAQNCAG